MINYCRTKIAEKNREEFHVLFLDKKNHIIADEMMGSGTVDHAPVYPREVIKRALELNALCAHSGTQPPQRRSHAVESRY